MSEQAEKKPRGFAALTPEERRERASHGGKASQARGTAHRWTSEEARDAGRKGGSLSRGGQGKRVDGDA